ncbi:MAG: NADH-quinone oxidoreductase subunit C [Acidimicrobiia bacterium]|nr:NADH-quinone oxidoreductase subunit C [Acidimicrobiia bacterium]
MPPEDKTADEEVTDQQVEATDEAAEAEGHAEQTAEGSGDVDEAAAGTVAETPAEPAEPADPTSPASEDELRVGLLESMKEALGESLVGAHILDGKDLWIRVTSDAWRQAAEAARTRLGCSSFTFLSAIDWLPSPYGRSETSPFDPPPDKEQAQEAGFAGGETRFQLFMRVQNPERGFGITIKADVADPDAGVETIIPVYAGANWHERETWEMYGITFVGHPHLVHIYLPGAFEGNPLRKDFPLLAREVKPWPGIVDVEPMPDDGDGDDAESEATEGEEVSA